MSATAPLLVLLARADRAALLAAIAELLRLSPERLPAATLAATGQGSARLALIAPPQRLAATLALAQERIGAEPARGRFALRRQGVFFASAATPGKIAILFPGQGSQYPGMLAQLRDRLPRVALWFDTLDQVYRQAGYAPPSDLLRPVGGTGQAPPGLYALQRGGPLGIIAELALFELVSELGLRADCVVGHSNGEHAAVFAAGRAPMDDPLVLTRGLLSVTQAADRLPPPPLAQQLLAVANLEPRRLAQLLGQHPDCRLAMDNCPNQQVIGGTVAACAAVRPALRAAQALVVALPFDRAYHTPLFADWRAVLADYYARLPLEAGTLPVLSCRDSRPLPRAPGACRRAMLSQWTAPVRFRRTVLALYRDGFRTFIEVGPGNTLCTFVADTLRGSPHLAVPTAVPRGGEWEQLQLLSAELFVQGVELTAGRLAPLLGRATVPPRAVQATTDLTDLACRLQQDLIARARAGHDRLRASLPLVCAALPSAIRPASDPTVRAAPQRLPFIGNPPGPRAGGLQLRRRFTRTTDPFVDHHALGRVSACAAADAFPLPVLPFTAGLAIAAEAGTLIGGAVGELSAVRALRWLALDQGVLDLDIVARPGPAGIAVSLGVHGEPIAFSANVGAALASPVRPQVPTPTGTAPRQWTAERFYQRYAFHGPGFQGLVRVTTVGPDGITAELRTTVLPGLAAGPLVLDPALLDCAGQLAAFWLLEQDGREPDFGLFPVAAERVLLQGPAPAPGGRCLCRAQIRPVMAGMTSADVCFETPDGAPIATLLGLRARLIALPPWFARTLFGGAQVRLPEDLAAVRELLLTQGRIWQRVLAHLSLSGPERLAWSECRAAGEGADWLLRRLGRECAAAGVPSGDRGVPCDA